jgi:large subunit ribosomal protein L10
VGVIASPITGLVRVLNALIAGLAIQLQQIAEGEMVPVGGTPAEAPAAEEPEETETPSEGEEEKEG